MSTDKSTLPEPKKEYIPTSAVVQSFDLNQIFRVKGEPGLYIQGSSVSTGGRLKVVGLDRKSQRMTFTKYLISVGQFHPQVKEIMDSLDSDKELTFSEQLTIAEAIDPNIKSYQFDWILKWYTILKQLLKTNENA